MWAKDILVYFNYILVYNMNFYPYRVLGYFFHNFSSIFVQMLFLQLEKNVIHLKNIFHYTYLGKFGDRKSFRFVNWYDTKEDSFGCLEPISIVVSHVDCHWNSNRYSYGNSMTNGWALIILDSILWVVGVLVGWCLRSGEGKEMYWISVRNVGLTFFLTQLLLSGI